MQPPSERFALSLPTRQADQIRRWGRLANALGVGPTFTAALRELHYRLTVEADEWGESRGEQEKPPLQWRFGVCSVLRVWYGLDLVGRVALVRDVNVDPAFIGDIPPGFE